MWTQIARRLAKKADKFINPTMAESFGEKLNVEIGDKYLNPYGFLKEAEFKEYEGVEKSSNEFEEVALSQKIEEVEKADLTPASAEQKEESSESENHEEYGFKVKGPEPTRFGDWERKGRCFDF